MKFKNIVLCMLCMLFFGMCANTHAQAQTSSECGDEYRDCLAGVAEIVDDIFGAFNAFIADRIQACEDRYQECIVSSWMRHVPLLCRSVWRWGCKGFWRGISAPEIVTTVFLNGKCWLSYQLCLERVGRGP